jgi:hypothetical protein
VTEDVETHEVAAEIAASTVFEPDAPTPAAEVEPDFELESQAAAEPPAVEPPAVEPPADGPTEEA